MKAHRYDKEAFLSSNAQDFIEETGASDDNPSCPMIPEQ